ncbi:aspartyl-phosphate phosphatase Spo0E family protein [Alkaliphilus pronyensis]|uniref:Aspartyl-phosphate phosphatase Spo0E family protein n=1 Tax=Alkaliphilus pronyensis TaxID=1482732 RepID=A0A6I0FDF5_9FIRM|nr:aspartyl-phosphate phosphatase Spo0E family protein [Alkaliphilus pronyensis]KAB3541000.1 aspartyl-phosphate phosphatase Spo0E family protein [Alkaliphilus pronyensis]
MSYPNNELLKLKEDIEKIRQKLNDLIMEEDYINNEIIEVSKALDKMIIDYIKLSKDTNIQKDDY